jgi:NADPH:quinone reductase-like Zn-dependent oxidoreductase
MQRWELPAFGRDNLVLTSALRPKPDPKEVLVKVEAVSLNYCNLLILENGLGGAMTCRSCRAAISPLERR